ncbi:MAG: AmmeMemoRadiSam system protein B, partial [Thermodesulfobacteriota bacterium]
MAASSTKPGKHAVRLVSTAVLAILFVALLFTSAVAAETPVRPSILAGQWYVADPAALAAEVAGFISRAGTVRLSGPLKAVVVPHAGHIYSGPVAAYGYAALKDADVKTVIMVGPSHHAAFPGVSVNVMDYQTPLGIVRVDRELAEEMIEKGQGLVSSQPEVHAREHCIEIQLPFLQVVKKPARFVPVVMGHQDLEYCRALAAVL